MTIKYTDTDKKAVADNPAWTKAELASARPFAEVFPVQAEAIQRARGRPKLNNPKVHVSLRLEPEIIEHFKSTGKGWQSRINAALKKAITQ